MPVKTITISTARIDNRIQDLARQMSFAMKNMPEKQRQSVKKQILGRIKELERLKVYLTGGLEKW